MPSPETNISNERKIQQNPTVASSAHKNTKPIGSHLSNVNLYHVSVSESDSSLISKKSK